MLLAWAVLAMWICGCLTWIVLLVITLQLPQGSSSTSCAAGKSHPWWDFPAKALRSLQNTRKARSRGRWSQREGFQQREGSLDEKSPQRRLQLSQLHFLSSQQQLPVWLVFAQLGNTRAGLAFWYPETAFFGLLQLWYIFCIEDRGQRYTVWKPLFLVCLIFASSKRGTALAFGGRVRTLSQNAANYTSKLLLKFHCLFWANSAALLQSCQEGHCWGFGWLCWKNGITVSYIHHLSSLLCPPPAHHTPLPTSLSTLWDCWVLESKELCHDIFPEAKVLAHAQMRNSSDTLAAT